MQFDVTFPSIPCSLLSVDAMDISGEQHLDIVCTIGFSSITIYLLNQLIDSFFFTSLFAICSFNFIFWFF